MLQLTSLLSSVSLFTSNLIQGTKSLKNYTLQWYEYFDSRVDRHVQDDDSEVSRPFDASLSPY